MLQDALRNNCADIDILLDYMVVKLRIGNWLGFVREPDVLREGSGPPDHRDATVYWQESRECYLECKWSEGVHFYLVVFRSGN